MKTKEEIEAMYKRLVALIQKTDSAFSNNNIVSKSLGGLTKLPLMGSREALAWVTGQDEDRALSFEASVKLAEDAFKEFGGAKDKVRASR